MQPFRFRLDRVLAWYRDQARAEESRFAECLESVARAHDAIEQLRADRLAAERQVISTSTISAQDLKALEPYRLANIAQECDLTLNLRRHELALKDQRERVKAEQMRVRSLEKMRERRIKEHDYAMHREIEDLAAESYISQWTQQIVAEEPVA
jgi:hypothetical protein